MHIWLMLFITQIYILSKCFTKVYLIKLAYLFANIFLFVEIKSSSYTNTFWSLYYRKYKWSLDTVWVFTKVVARHCNTFQVLRCHNQANANRQQVLNLQKVSATLYIYLTSSLHNAINVPWNYSELCQFEKKLKFMTWCLVQFLDW